jgi:glycogen operon protein
MLLGGDEFLRTQAGNNNAYCQDNALSWFDWNRAQQNRDLVAFCQKAIALTRRYTVLQSRKFLDGADSDGNGIPDISWFGTDGYAPAWNDAAARILCYRLDGAEEASAAGDYQLFIIFNADYRVQGVTLPFLQGKKWHRLIDTSLGAEDDFVADGREVEITPADAYLANSRSTVMLLAK